ncbi:2-succinyl-6-hydroxy-2,4-cyclohexadiene-1-carboxylate synthase [Coleofasciculus sp. LEGE 07081]|uniref:2-succinyl-6-hydroxy-2, 4-cyclohexadiene-1-carboxylate synthase n=1 Tax=unclassified Coleofasciculus TaxID=2692782 RepID=UPI001880A31A|nr:2-succinyl-6-hydroxy-2,4-cyclohexadiene-1-carboxylate synthase [Coleofasciculus sp. LEGE 07081]MBE9149146.1 2-succinyl-6-hydroxy-2,4-cyclohexadiene-1-carboxylate synthase [Coleofasciculus sp. LEGE 07092]
MNFENYNVHYYFRGNRSQPILLFLHGFLGNSQDFSRVISVLSQQFCCLAVDLPGHGKTRVLGSEECYTLSNTAQGLIEFLNHLNIDQCFIVGYSMGGRLALYMTLEFPARFQRVILESASPGLKTERERSLRLQADEQRAEELETSNFQSFLSNWYSQPLFQSLQNHTDLKHLIERRLQNNPEELAKSLRQMGTGKQPSLWERLKQNKIPLLLLVGEYDQKFRTINTEIANICPVAHLKIIPKTGHNIHLENSTAWVNQVRQFCALAGG